MADVVGPVSSLPGTLRTLPDGAMCDEHPSRQAVARVQGETDSFGAELLDLCGECLRAFRSDLKAAQVGRCDWCGDDARDLRDSRDFDEGLCGRVYRICGACSARQKQRLLAEWEDIDDRY